MILQGCIWGWYCLQVCPFPSHLPLKTQNRIFDHLLFLFRKLSHQTQTKGTTNSTSPVCSSVTYVCMYSVLENGTLNTVYSSWLAQRFHWTLPGGSPPPSHCFYSSSCSSLLNLSHLSFLVKVHLKLASPRVSTENTSSGHSKPSSKS